MRTNDRRFLISARALVVALVVSLLAIAVVSSAFAYEYLGLSSDLSSKNSTISDLSATVGAQAGSISSLNSNVTSEARSISTVNSEDASQANYILTLQEMLNSMSAQIRTLNSTIAALDSNQTALGSQQQALELKLLGIESSSSQVQTELSVVEQVGTLAIVPFFTNDTVTVPGDSNITVTQQLNGYNGTLIWLSPNSCPSPGITYRPNPTGGSYYILLKANSSTALGGTETIGPSAFVLYLSNTGTASVKCTLSLYWVYQGPF
jgi:hypothetical protein